MFYLLDILVNGKMYHEQLAIAPLIIAGIIAAAGSIISGVLKSKSDSNANAQQMQYNQDAYNQQRQDALADWQRQTDYNSPTAQMARMKAAGLNPILAAGNITTTSPTVRSSDYQSFTPRSVNPLEGLDKATSQMGDSLVDYYDVKIKEAQYDNLKTQNTVMLQDQMLKAAQTAATTAMEHKTGADTAMQEFNLQQSQRLSDVSAQIQEQNLRKLQADTDFTVHSDTRATLSNNASLQETATRIVNNKLEALQKQAQTAQTRQQTQNARAEYDRIKKITDGQAYDNQIKQLELRLRQSNISPNDPLWQKTIKLFFDKLFGTKDNRDPYLMNP